ncbi:MAG: putative toxin-antitoxin system toxin component, PIN family [Salinisphaera sp.]|nr:putative toxin-antitoxin system toxin component, PIN family [Salinisphaera sp.]
MADTNTVVSALLWGGTPRQILDGARQKDLTLFTSAILIAELEDVLSRSKFQARIARVGSSVAEILGDYLALATLTRPATPPPAIVRDPDDDHVIACALAAQAEVIVSGDGDLLELGEYRGIAILSAAQMLQRITTT